MLKSTNGAVVVEMLGQRVNKFSLVYSDYHLIYDLVSKHYLLFNILVDPKEKFDIARKNRSLKERFDRIVERYLKTRGRITRIKYTRKSGPILFED